MRDDRLSDSTRSLANAARRSLGKGGSATISTVDGTADMDSPEGERLMGKMVTRALGNTKALPTPPADADDREARKKARATPRVDVLRSEEAAAILGSLTMKKALEIEEQIIWPKGNKYMAAPAAEAIAHVLIKKISHHVQIRDYKILFLFKEKMNSRGKQTLAKASKADPKVAFFTDATFVMEINHEAWYFLPADAKVALIDHELNHYGVEFDDDGVKEPVLVDHDIEEFHSIIERWGLWKNDVKRFAESIQLALDFGAAGKAKSK